MFCRLEMFLRWKNAVFVTLEIWFSKDRLLSNITPRFLTVEEVTVHPSSCKLWSKRFWVLFFGPISNISVLSEFDRRKLLVIQYFIYTHRPDDQRQHSYDTSCVIHLCENFMVQLAKVLQYQEWRSGCWCLPAILALSAQCYCADVVSCLHKLVRRGMQIHTSTGRWGSQLKCSERAFIGPTPFSEYINTD